MKKLVIILATLFITPLCFAETAENYLATFEVIEEAISRSDSISVDQDLYDSFAEQLALINDQIDLLMSPVDPSDPDESDLYNYLIGCQSALASLGQFWYLAIFFDGSVEPDKIKEYLDLAKDDRANAILQLDAAWGNYYQVDFPGSGGTGVGSGGSETEKNYLTTFQEIEAAVSRSEDISVNEVLYNAFSEQLLAVNDQIDVLEEPVNPSDTDETDLYNNILACQTFLAELEQFWYLAILFDGTVEPDKIASYLNSAEDAKSLAVLHLDAAWGNYYQTEFPRPLGGGDSGGGGGGSSGLFSCFIITTSQ